MCKELSSIVDRQAIEGVQRIHELWHIFLKKHDAKTKLYTMGMTFRVISVPVYGQNSFCPQNENRNPHNII
jgi:hypothetical protein